MMYLLGFVFGAALGSIAAIPCWTEKDDFGYIIVVLFGVAFAFLLPLMGKVTRIRKH